MPNEPTMDEAKDSLDNARIAYEAARLHLHRMRSAAADAEDKYKEASNVLHAALSTAKKAMMRDRGHGYEVCETVPSSAAEAVCIETEHDAE